MDAHPNQPAPEIPSEPPVVQRMPLPVLPGVVGLFQAYAESRLEEPLRAQEMEASMVEQVQSYAVTVAARHKMGPGVAWMGVSQDGQRVGMRDTVGVMWDFVISEAFTASAQDHLNEAISLAQGKAQGSPAMTQAYPAPAMQPSAGGVGAGDAIPG